jgi:hypothetical protein
MFVLSCPLVIRVGRSIAVPETNDRLARVKRSIAEVEADGRPARIKDALLAALRKERDALSALVPKPIAASRKTPPA